jgi:hypothetical protein
MLLIAIIASAIKKVKYASQAVIPAQAGIHCFLIGLDSGSSPE